VARGLDGKLVLAGFADNDFALARYLVDSDHHGQFGGH